MELFKSAFSGVITSKVFIHSFIIGSLLMVSEAVYRIIKLIPSLPYLEIHHKSSMFFFGLGQEMELVSKELTTKLMLTVFIDIFKFLYTVVQFVTKSAAEIIKAIFVRYIHNCIYNKTINQSLAHFTSTQDMFVNE